VHRQERARFFDVPQENGRGQPNRRRQSWGRWCPGVRPRRRRPGVFRFGRTRPRGDGCRQHRALQNQVPGGFHGVPLVVEPHRRLFFLPFEADIVAAPAFVVVVVFVRLLPFPQTLFPFSLTNSLLAEVFFQRCRRRHRHNVLVLSRISVVAALPVPLVFLLVLVSSGHLCCCCCCGCGYCRREDSCFESLVALKRVAVCVL